MNPLDHGTNRGAQSFDQFLAVPGACPPNRLGAPAALPGNCLLACAARILMLRLDRAYDRLATQLGWQPQPLHSPIRHSSLERLSRGLHWLLLFTLTTVADLLRIPGVATWPGKLWSVLSSLFGAGAFLVYPAQHNHRCSGLLQFSRHGKPPGRPVTQPLNCP